MGTSNRTAISRVAAVLALLAVLGAAAWSATWVVKSNETGVVLAFGRVERVVPPGMQLTLPWPFGSLVRVDTNSVDRLSVGFRLAEQMMGLPPTEDMVQWLTGDTNIVELQAVVLYSIADPVKFLFGVADSGDPGGPRLAEPQRMVVRRAAEAALTRRIANLKIDLLLSEGKIELQASSVAEIQAVLDQLDCGIRVSAVQIQSVNPPKLVIDTFNEVQSARSDRERRIADGDGYVRDVLPKARGRANSMLEEAETYRTEQVSRAQSAAANFDKVLIAAARDRPAVIQRQWVDTMVRVMKKARVIQVDDDPNAPPFRLFLEK